MKHFVTPINLLLVFLPIAVVAELAHWPPTVVFVSSALAVIPLSSLLGNAAEEPAGRAGPRAGAPLNATMGNAAELIITILAIREGPPTPQPTRYARRSRCS
jgi:Ca2+:H+ antiporter